jgi:hypothetical protein
MFCLEIIKVMIFMRSSQLCRSGLLLFLVLTSPAISRTQTVDSPGIGADPLQSGFLNPPNSARPRVWWHWMNGNITPIGIQLDLDWMKRAGLGGVTVFEGSLDTPQVVPHRLIYMTPDWKAAFNGALDRAMSHNFEFVIASSPGWSESGGPWVPPSQGMKKLVWSAVRVTGGRPFNGSLPALPHATGTFQNYDLQGHRDTGDSKAKPPLPQFAADAAVVAYRVPDADKTQTELHPVVTASGGRVTVAALSDGDVQTPALLLPPGAAGTSAWVLLDYGHPQAIQSITLGTTDDIVSFFGFDDQKAGFPSLEASDDGQSFHRVAEIPYSSVAQRTISFAPVTARYFRVNFPTPAGATKVHPHQITELVLNNGARTDEWERRAGFATTIDYYAIHDFPAAPGFVVRKADVVDLTRKMKADGTLDWTPPPGKWEILRLGESLTGRENEPAPAEATGLEVDKLNRGYVKNYFDHYLNMYADTVGQGRMGSTGITYMVTDSIEVGAQNWTDDMLAEFERRRGYSALPWLPALTGVVIESTAETNRFLWDFRRTIAQLFAENHYGTISDELHKRGLHYYGEALEFRRPSLGDDMEMRSKTDVPMGAMWAFAEKNGPNPTYVADDRGAASVAHIYGQNLAGAESMTAGPPAWIWSPNTLKRIADMEFALGINRFEIHESTHQPLVGPGTAPGLTLGIFGQWFTRNETWAEDARPWIDYLARSSYLLQQGHFYGDVAYFYGQEGPLTAVFGIHPQTDAPVGYGFDFVNSDVLLRKLSMENGRLVTAGGTSYRLLYLGGTSWRMTVPVLRKLEALVEQGAVVDGNRPVDSPSLADDPAEFKRLTDRLWGGRPNAAGYRAVGQGRVYDLRPAGEVLANLNLPRDFDYNKPSPDTKLMFLHRKLADGDVYFVDSRNEQAQNVNATFRITGKRPELWDAATGQMAPAAYRCVNGLTTVPLHLDPYGTVFVLFRHPTEDAQQTVSARVETVLPSNELLDTNWHVTFQPARGAPAEAKFPRLLSWSDSSDTGIKYFSGAATYSKTVEAPAAWFHPGAHLWLDLGTVHELAAVTINGKPVGTAWKAPFQIDVTDALRPGPNKLEIRVTNLWVNRLIGDAQPNATRKYAFTDIVPYKAGSPLLPSGLIGPVRMLSVTGR